MIKHWFDQLGRLTGMEKQMNNPFDCGSYFLGTNEMVNGFAWYYTYSNLLTVSKCDFTFTKDVNVKMNEKIQYLGIRLDYGKYPSPGKILAFLEDNHVSFDMYVKKGTRFAYTEVLYTPKLYSKHFHKAFANIKSNPAEIIRSMGSEHNWSSKISDSLMNIRYNASVGPSAELFYIGESCKLLSALIDMGTDHIPRKITDFEDIQRVIQYIDKHYRGNIKQADLVRVANMSPTKLKTLFKTFTDQSISDYISEKKAALAAQMLSETDLSIEAIANAVGFSTPSGFLLLFKKRRGISPSQYRKQMGYTRMNNISYFEAIGVEIIKESEAPE